MEGGVLLPIGHMVWDVFQFFILNAEGFFYLKIPKFINGMTFKDLE